MNLPEATAEADGVGSGVGLGGAPTLVDPVGLGPPVGEDVVVVPEQAAAAKATDKIASAAGLTGERGTLLAVPCRIIVVTPPAWQLMAARGPEMSRVSIGFYAPILGQADVAESRHVARRATAADEGTQPARSFNLATE
jgi:hypothetical protein